MQLKTIISFQNDAIHCLDQHTLSVCLWKEVAVVDLNEKMLTGFEFDEIHPASPRHKGYLLLCRDGKWGVMQLRK